jgi:hypothetical protein
VTCGTLQSGTLVKKILITEYFSHFYALDNNSKGRVVAGGFHPIFTFISCNLEIWDNSDFFKNIFEVINFRPF